MENKIEPTVILRDRGYIGTMGQHMELLQWGSMRFRGVGLGLTGCAAKGSGLKVLGLGF